MLDLYHVVGLVPELEAAAAGGIAVTSFLDEPTTTTATDSSATRNLASLILPCTDMLDSYHLGADVRLASGERQALRSTFANKVS